MSSDIVSAKQGNNAGEAGKLIQKRLRPGKNPRSRPIDRQHIRDRLNELREIVPHGAKVNVLLGRICNLVRVLNFDAFNRCLFLL